MHILLGFLFGFIFMTIFLRRKSEEGRNEKGFQYKGRNNLHRHH